MIATSKNLILITKKVSKSCIYCGLIMAFIVILIGSFENLFSENSVKTFRDVREDIKMPSMTICPYTVYRSDCKNSTTL